MIEERFIFHLAFGEAKQGIALLNEAMVIVKNECGLKQRLLSDLTGDSYTMIIEIMHTDESKVNPNNTYWNLTPNLTPVHEKFSQICMHCEKELYSIVVNN